MAPFPLAAVVLCGGRSSRMGTEKALLEIEDEPLVRRVARRVGVACDPVMLAPGYPGRLGHAAGDYREVADEAPGAGPLGGLVAGVAASPHQLVAAVAVDMPFASAAVLQLLAALHDGEDAIVPRTAQGLEPLHAVYARSALPRLRVALAEGRWSVRDVLAGLRVRAVDAEGWNEADPSGRFAINLNRAEDLSLLAWNRD